MTLVNMKPQRVQGKRWVVTINNPTEEDLHAMQQLIEGDELLTAIVGSEGKDRTPHLR